MRTAPLINVALEAAANGQLVIGGFPAHEILLNSPTVAGIIAEGRTSQLPMAIEGARRQGMQPLNDALAGLVQSGSVDVREAYRQASDRGGFLTLRKRLGMDTALIV